MGAHISTLATAEHSLPSQQDAPPTVSHTPSYQSSTEKRLNTLPISMATVGTREREPSPANLSLTTLTHSQVFADPHTVSSHPSSAESQPQSEVESESEGEAAPAISSSAVLGRRLHSVVKTQQEAWAQRMADGSSPALSQSVTLGPTHPSLTNKPQPLPGPTAALLSRPNLSLSTDPQQPLPGHKAALLSRPNLSLSTDPQQPLPGHKTTLLSRPDLSLSTDPQQPLPGHKTTLLSRPDLSLSTDPQQPLPGHKAALLSRPNLSLSTVSSDLRPLTYQSNTLASDDPSLDTTPTHTTLHLPTNCGADPLIPAEMMTPELTVSDSAATSCHTVSHLSPQPSSDGESLQKAFLRKKMKFVRQSQKRLEELKKGSSKQQTLQLPPSLPVSSRHDQLRGKENKVTFSSPVLCRARHTTSALGLPDT